VWVEESVRLNLSPNSWLPGLPDYILQYSGTGKSIPNEHRMYQKTVKYTILSQSRQNDNKKYQDFPLQELLKITQIRILV
jgi:hypothetical protein